MIASAGLVAAILAGALVFEAQEMPELRLSLPDPATGEATANFRHADLDGDGAPDLVFNQEVRFQRAGRFPLAESAPLPGSDANADLDVWEDRVFVKTPGRLRMLAWNGAAWDTALDSPLDAPGDVAEEPWPAAAGVRLQRFLCDLDGDGAPEVVQAGSRGLVVFRRQGSIYAEAGLLDVLPPLRLAPPAVPALWPESGRRIGFPAREMACHIALSAARVVVAQTVDGSSGHMRYRRHVFNLEFVDGRFVANRAGESDDSPAVPAFLTPCRLNADGGPHFAGRTREPGPETLLPAPHYTVWASLDGGESFTRRNGQAFRVHAMMVDFDGDGDLDLVTEATGLFRGGARETLLRYLTHRVVEHTLNVYIQARGRFGAEPALTGRVEIRLPAPPALDGALFPRYQGYGECGLIDLSGDFNGDGYKDLLVQDRADRLAVYLAAGHAYPDAPSVVLPAENVRAFGAMDINGDGRDDIVVRRADGEQTRTFVHFAQEAAP